MIEIWLYLVSSMYKSLNTFQINCWERESIWENIFCIYFLLMNHKNIVLDNIKYHSDLISPSIILS